MQPRRQRKQPVATSMRLAEESVYDGEDDKIVSHASASSSSSSSWCRSAMSCSTRRFFIVMIALFFFLHTFVVSYLVTPPFSLTDLVDGAEISQNVRRALRPTMHPKQNRETASLVSESDTFRWHGSFCRRSAYLTHEKLVRYCRNPKTVSMPIAPAYCAKILLYAAQKKNPNVGGKPSSPPCGFFAGGTFNSIPTLHSEARLKDIRASIGCHAASPGLSSGVFSGTQSNKTLVSQEINEALVEFKQHRVLPRANDAASGPLANCPNTFRYLDRLEVLSVLHTASIGKHGRGIIFSGDSMVRQMMLRLMFFLRGKKQEALMAEHYFHCDGLYIVYKEPATDELIVLPRSIAEKNQTIAAILRTFFPGYLTSATGGGDESAAVADNVLLAILFVWDPYVETFRKDVLNAFAATPAHVSAFMYWWQKTEMPEAVNSYLDAMEANMNVSTCVAPQPESVIPSLPTKHFIYLTTPNTTGFKNENLRHERNDILRRRLGEKPRWCSSTPLASQKSFAVENGKSESAKVVESTNTGQKSPKYSYVRSSLLDYAAIADTRLLPRTMDEIHFMCTWTEVYPQQISKMKYNKFGCTDPTNLAAVQWLAHLLLDTI